MSRLAITPDALRELIHQLPRGLKELRFASDDASDAFLIQSLSSAPRTKIKPVQRSRGLSKLIDMDALFPELQTFKLVSTTFDSADLAGLPSTLTCFKTRSLGFCYNEPTDRFLSWLPRQLERLECAVMISVGFYEDDPEGFDAAVAEDWIHNAPPSLQHISILELSDIKLSVNWLPRSLTHCAIIPNEGKITSEFAASVPPFIEEVEVHLHDLSSNLRSSPNYWTSLLPTAIKTLGVDLPPHQKPSVQDAFALYLLPPTISTLTLNICIWPYIIAMMPDAYDTNDSSALSSSALSSAGFSSSHRHFNWPPYLTQLQLHDKECFTTSDIYLLPRTLRHFTAPLIVRELDHVDRSMFPPQLTHLELDPSWDSSADSARPDLSRISNYLPSSLTHLCFGISISPRYPTNHLVPLEGGLGHEMFSHLPRLRTLIASPRLSPDDHTNPWCLSSMLTYLKVSKWYSEHLHVLPETLQHLFIQHLRVLAPEVTGTNLLPSLPRHLVSLDLWLAELENEGKSKLVSLINISIQLPKPLPELETLILFRQTRIHSSFLRQLPLLPSLRELVVEANPIEEDVVFLPPRLRICQLFSSVPRKAYLAQHWPLSALQTMQYHDVDSIIAHRVETKYGYKMRQ